MRFARVTPTMLESECRRYQISRTPCAVAGTHIYRLWLRENSEVLLALTVMDTEDDRRAAVERCKLAAVEHAETQA